MELATGRAGSPHITAQQDRQKHQGIWGDGAYILATGNQLEPEVQSSNKILIKDGALMFQGALFTVKVGTTDEITINNGNQGMQRKDLVVARYKYDSSRGSVKNFVALVKNSSFLVRITDMTILIEKEFIYGSSKRPNSTDYYRKQHYQCG